MRIVCSFYMLKGTRLAPVHCDSLVSMGGGAQSGLPLPAPSQERGLSVEEAIARRRSKRSYLRKPLTVAQLSQLLWAAQGVTNLAGGLRSAPSAGGLYPLELYVFVREGGVSGLAAGVYRYGAERHELRKVRDGDLLGQLETAALDEGAIGMSAVCIVMTAVLDRTTRKYGRRGIQYIHQESGAAAENLCLQATALGLGTVIVGSFEEASVGRMIGLGSGETPVCLLPVGIPAPG